MCTPRLDALGLFVLSPARVLLCGLSLSLVFVASARAQVGPSSATASVGQIPIVSSEEVEPRILGKKGTVTLGVGGYVDRSSSTENLFATNYTAQADVAFFLMRKVVVRGGLAGSGSIGGDEDVTLPAGVGVASLNAFGGASYYFTPESIWSIYAGADYWAQLTQRSGADRGSIVSVAGLQAALSSRMSLFAEGGYGVNLTRGSEGESITRILGRVGLRVRIRE